MKSPLFPWSHLAGLSNVCARRNSSTGRKSSAVKKIAGKNKENKLFIFNRFSIFYRIVGTFNKCNVMKWWNEMTLGKR